MRLRTLIPIGVAGGAAAYLFRDSTAVKRRVIDPITGVVTTVLGTTMDRVDRITQPDPNAQRARQLADEASLDDLDMTPRDVVDQLAVGSSLGAMMADSIDVRETPAASNVDLVEAERDLLTVPGSDHRRRRQTAGLAAQDIAAAQVRDRRNGVDDADWE